MTDFDRAFDALFARWVTTRAGEARVEHDPEWTSPCEIGDVDGDGRIAWRPVLRSVPADLTSLEKMAGKPVPEPVLRFLGNRYFGRIAASYLDGDERVPVNLRSIWNDEAYEREIATVQTQIRNSREETGRAFLCIANTGDDRFFAVSLENGEVTLEDFGREPIRVAASLAAFLDALIV